MNLPRIITMSELKDKLEKSEKERKIREIEYANEKCKNLINEYNNLAYRTLAYAQNNKSFKMHYEINSKRDAKIYIDCTNENIVKKDPPFILENTQIRSEEVCNCHTSCDKVFHHNQDYIEFSFTTQNNS